ncbi:hypothetical protein AAC387_Pa06g1078 [Persea americana]
MDVKNAKVMSNGRKVPTDWNTKQVAQPSAPCELVRQQVTLDTPLDRHCKRVRLGGCKNSCKCSFRKSVVKNYSHFMKSGLPQHIFSYESREWKILPKEIVPLLKDDFQKKKAITEIVFKGKVFLFDFSHMVQVDTETSLQQPIAWIDESGNSFFPELELYSNIDELLLPSNGEDQIHVNFDPNETGKIKVQISVTGSDISVLGEGNETSIFHSKRPKIEWKKTASDDCKLNEVYCNFDKSDERFGKGIGENVLRPFSASEYFGFESKRGKLDKLVIGGSDYNAIQKMLLVGFGPSLKVSDIVGIFHSSPTDILVQARLQLFQKQIEIMRTHRGNANVRYAWFSSSKETVSRIMFHRFEHTDMPKFKPLHGIGIHLSATSSRISANYYSDVDENGLQHMLLCRVIMGNVELIHPGSKQFQPISENFDSGVDDLQNPLYYIIWGMHMNSHIYPEYVVSFRVPSKDEELIVREIGCDTPDSGPVNLVGTSQQFAAWVKQSQERARDYNERVPNIPSSPWLPFPMLLNAVSNKIPSENMELVGHHYDEFKMKTISRAEFIIKLRSIVGDDLLRSSITSLKSKVS